MKISDLGLSVKANSARGYAGTPGYTAPEVCKGDRYDKTSDFFSYGVLIYRFLSGKVRHTVVYVWTIYPLRCENICSSSGLMLKPVHVTCCVSGHAHRAVLLLG